MKRFQTMWVFLLMWNFLNFSEGTPTSLTRYFPPNTYKIPAKIGDVIKITVFLDQKTQVGFTGVYDVVDPDYNNVNVYLFDSTTNLQTGTPVDKSDGASNQYQTINYPVTANDTYYMVVKLVNGTPLTLSMVISRINSTDVEVDSGRMLDYSAQYEKIVVNNAPCVMIFDLNAPTTADFQLKFYLPSSLPEFTTVLQMKVEKNFSGTPGSMSAMLTVNGTYILSTLRKPLNATSAKEFTITYDCVVCGSLIENCSVCLSQTECDTCIYGYYPSNSSTVCSHCSTVLANCTSCLTETDCESCETGFIIEQVSGLVCEPCSTYLSNCISCIDYDKCATCEIISYRQSHSNGSLLCILCEDIHPFCSSCTNSECYSCTDEGILDGTQCDPCSDYVTDCKKCYNSSAIVTVCTECDSGFYSVDDHNCDACNTIHPQCNDCSVTGDCTSCNDAFFLLNSTYCEECRFKRSFCGNCSNDGNQCFGCISDSYVFNNSNGVCTHCSSYIEGCDRCSNIPTCFQCLDTHVLQPNGTCTDCGSFFSYCETCSNQTHCLTTNNDMYFINGGIPTLCSLFLANCHRCTNGLACSECEDYFYLNGSQCQSCDQKYCHRCVDTDTCLECDEGYEVHASGNCTCPEGQFYVPIGCTDMPGCLSLYPLTTDNYQNDTQKQCLLCDPSFYYNYTLRECVCQLGYKASGMICVEDCGDGVHYEQACDDGNKVSLDGCSKTCEVEEGYVCENGPHPNFDKSVCKLDASFDIEFLYIKKVDRENKGEIHFLLSGLDDGSNDQFGKLGRFDLQKCITVSESVSKVTAERSDSSRRLSMLSFPVESVQTITEHNKVIVTFSYESSQIDKQLSVDFDFGSILTDSQFQSISLSTSNMDPPLQFSENTALLSFIHTTSTIVAYCSLLFFVVSLAIHKSIGAETLNAIQMGFCCLFLTQSQESVFRTLQPLALSMGITPIFSSSWSNLINPQKFRIFSDSRSLINDINIFLFALLAAFLVFVLLKIKKGYHRRTYDNYNRFIRALKQSNIKSRAKREQLKSQAEGQKLYINDFVFHANHKAQFIYQRFLYPLAIFLLPATIFMLTRQSSASIDNEPLALTEGKGSNLWEFLLSIVVFGVCLIEIRAIYRQVLMKQLKVHFAAFKESCKNKKAIQRYLGFYIISVLTVCLTIMAIHTASTQDLSFIPYILLTVTIFFAIMMKCYSPYIITFHNNCQSLNYLLVAYSLLTVICDRNGVLEEQSALACCVIWQIFNIGVLGLGVYRLLTQYQQNQKGLKLLRINGVSLDAGHQRKRNIKETFDQNPYIYRNQKKIEEAQLQGDENQGGLNRDGSKNQYVNNPKEELQKLKKRLRSELQFQKEQQELYNQMYLPQNLSGNRTILSRNVV